ncbi:unnamed protein product [Rotaria sp. Silwood2]|nr:unnamed protein product [Rotaria sp. Silwood2]CAF3961215.1 unnamed protein product [Rotaria sp. Silwood2]
MIIPCLAASNSQEAKQQKATAIAGRLLKELADEQLASHHKEQSLEKDENNEPKTEKIETHSSTESDDTDDEDIDFVPMIDDLYEMYAANKYNQEPDDEESSSELIDNEYMLPINRQQLLRYFAEDEDDSDENLIPVIHSPVMDDTQMTAENH